MITLFLIMMILATPTNASNLDYFYMYENIKEAPEQKKEEIEKNYTLISYSELNDIEQKIVEEHEKQTKYIMKSSDMGDYNVKCLNLVEKVIEQSYEGCMLTTNLKTNVTNISGMIPEIANKEKGREIDINEQTKAHNDQLKKMKTMLCNSAMKAAKYHKQQAYCRRPQSNQWYEIADDLLNLKIYKYIGIYIKKTDIIWRGLREKNYDRNYINHPANLAGNIRNMAYDTDTYYLEQGEALDKKQKEQQRKEKRKNNFHDIKYNYISTH